MAIMLRKKVGQLELHYWWNGELVFTEYGSQKLLQRGT